MNETDVLDIAQSALWVVLLTAGPIMFAGLLIGLIIALFQALTTIQEMTLTFVPKIIVIFVAIVVFLFIDPVQAFIPGVILSFLTYWIISYFFDKKSNSSELLRTLSR